VFAAAMTGLAHKPSSTTPSSPTQCVQQARHPERKRLRPVVPRREPKHSYTNKVYAESFGAAKSPRVTVTGSRREGQGGFREAPRPLPKLLRNMALAEGYSQGYSQSGSGQLPWLLVVDDPEMVRGQWAPLPSVVPKRNMPHELQRAESRVWNGALPPL
jgi:hypothetical protein